MSESLNAFDKSHLAAMVKISASLLAADFLHLADSISEAERAGVDEFHFDIMDGSFVPNISFGPPLLEAVAEAASVPIDAHMMVRTPENTIPAVASSGADIVTVHIEAVADIDATIDIILAAGATPAVAIRPRTPIEALHGVIDRIERILIMTVEPGFGGQSFMRDQLPKICAATQLSDWRDGRPMEIAVDGGIKEDTIGMAAQNGATTFISGTGIFKHPEGIAGGIAAAREEAVHAVSHKPSLCAEA